MSEERELRLMLIKALTEKVGDPNWDGSAPQKLAALLLGDDWEPSAYESLARNLIRESTLTADEGLAREAVAVLERATEAYPEHQALAEMLVACYLRFGPEEKAQEALGTLEQLAPDSEIFRIRDTVDEEGARAFAAEVSQRVENAFRIAASGDSELRAPAVAELRHAVASFPRNRRYRELYAFALMCAGEQEALHQQAERLAAEVPDDHAAHFNLGQMFWRAGDPKRGRHHLDLSLRYAKSDEEKRDVAEQIATLERYCGG